MHMNMEYFLATVFVTVHNQAVSIFGNTFLGRNFGRYAKNATEHCFIFRLHVRDVDHLEEVIDRFVPYGQTTTSIIHSAPVPRRGPPLEI